jgi:hypothetical protein
MSVKSETIKLVGELEDEFLKKSGTGSQVSIFLCGGAGKHEEELRKAIGTRIVDLTSKYAYAVHYPEDFFIELMLGHQKHDLLSLENILANSVHAVAIILHSPGTFAELGAFSNHPALSQKLIIVTDPKYRNHRSFINLGPIRFLQTKTRSKILHIQLNQGNLDNLATSIAEAAREIAKTSSPRHDLTNPLAAYQFFLAVINVFDPIPKSALINLVDSLRPSDGKLIRTVGETVVNSLINERKVFYNGIDLSITSEGRNELLLSGRTKRRINERSWFLTKIRLQALNQCLRKYHRSIWEGQLSLAEPVERRV